MVRINLLHGCYVEAKQEPTPDGPRCKDCGDPATLEAGEQTVSSIWGVMISPKVPVCYSCYQRRTKK